MDANRASYIVSEALVLRTKEDRRDANGVDPGQHVNRAQKISAERFLNCDFASRVANHANAGLTLSRCLSLPQGLKDPEITPIYEEPYEYVQGKHPFAGFSSQAESCAQDAKQDQQQEHAYKLNQAIDE